MKKLFFLICIIFTNFVIAQTSEISGANNVEVGINNMYTFRFISATDPNYDKYKINYMTIQASGGSNVNNTGNFTITDYTFFGSEYNIGVNNSISRPISFSDVGTFQVDNVILEIGYQKRNKISGFWENFNPLRTTLSVTVNRIKQPTISTPIVQACCPNQIVFTASDFGAANQFNWNNISGATIVSGQGTSSIVVESDVSLNSISFNLNVGRTQNPGYTKSANKFIQKTPRNISYTISAPPVFTYDSQQYLCKSTGRTFSVTSQCGLQNVTWTAPNCTIIGQGTANATIIPNANVLNGSLLDIYGTANFVGGCSIQMPTTNFRVFDTGTTTAPVGGTVLVSSFPANFALQNASHWVFDYRMQKGTSINYSNSIFTFNPDVAIITSYNRTITVSACSLNVCNGNTSCQDYQVFLPGVPNWQPYRVANTLNEEANGSGKLKFSIVPNPSNGDFAINFEDYTTGYYEILESTSGIVIVNQKFSNEKELKIITPNAIKSGLYLLKITSNENTTISKIILNK